MPEDTKPGMKVSCPKCGSWDAHPSRKRSVVLDSLMRIFDMQPYRCRACTRRFYAKPRGKESGDHGTEQDAPVGPLVR